MDENYKKINKLRNRSGCALLLTAFFTTGVLLTFIIISAKKHDINYCYLGGLLTLLTFAILYYGLYIPQKKKHIKLYKNQIVRSCLESVFEDVTYEPEEFFDADVIQKANLVQLGNVYKGDDKITAKYKGVQFSLCNLEMKDVVRRHSRGFPEDIIHFCGTWIILDFDNYKPYFIKSKNIMTKNYLNTLSKLQALTDGMVLDAFVGNKLHIAINSNVNTFEPPASDSVDNYQDYVMTEALFIAEIIDELIG